MMPAGSWLDQHCVCERLCAAMQMRQEDIHLRHTYTAGSGGLIAYIANATKQLFANATLEKREQ